MSEPYLPFVGPSEALRAFFEELELAAESEAVVLLQGESGVGKARAARLVHERGPRREGPFVSVNLAATAQSLIESTLFGHERGAFTDAHRTRRGLFQKSHGGTLVLEDVDLVPREIQGKLLRVLQERRVEPLGSEESHEVDVRLVSTTSAALRPLIEAGEFREDLYFRLAVIPIVVPTLRARQDDLEALTAALTAAVAQRAGVRPRPLSPAAADLLRAHAWPGNVRELENALERVLVLVPGRQAKANQEVAEIQAEELSFLGEACVGIVDDVAERALKHGLTVEDVTQAMMRRALLEHRGNVSAAARQVGLTRRAFDYRARRPESEAEVADDSPSETLGADE